MRLKLFSVTNFRSITKAEKLPLGDLTVLVGPNNEGKSNILEALAIGMQELGRPTHRTAYPPGSRRRFGASFERAGELVYRWDRDFPQALQEKTEGRTTMNFDFELTPEEVEEFHKEVGSRFNEALPISLTFGSSGRSSFRVRKRGPSQQALSKKRSAIAQFVAERVQLQYVPAVRTGERAANIVRRMLSRELASATSDPAYAEALEHLQALQGPILEKLSRSITTQLQSFLPEVQGVSIEYEEEERALTRGVSVVVDDGVPTDLIFKGDGVQSLAALAMMQHYSRETAKAREFILAVEEPEAHLHPSAIHALKETLRETAEKQQVVITTHSPLFVNRLDLASNIIVTKNRAAPASSVQELREILGVHVADNLAAAEVVLVVEGQEDEKILRAVLLDRAAEMASAMRDGVLTIISLHGAGKLSYLLAQLRDSLASTHAFLDNDRAGQDAAKAAGESGLLASADLTMAMCPGERKGCELEDLIDPIVYSEPFMTAFGVDLDHPWTKQMSKGKWSSRMSTVFQASGAQWNKGVEKEAKALVAAGVQSAPGSALKDGCTGVVASLAGSLQRKLDSRSQ
jgi:energy-coupling factor transporter ATP-binding protein EcfA2